MKNYTFSLKLTPHLLKNSCSATNFVGRFDAMIYVPRIHVEEV